MVVGDGDKDKADGQQGLPQRDAYDVLLDAQRGIPGS